MNRQTLRSHWPLAIVCLFAALMVVGFRQKSKAAVAPPYADALQYYCKASFVWEDISAGKFSNIMASPPALRPPGTALLLYPFGFKQDVKTYLFRSQLAPFLIWMASLMVIAWPPCKTTGQRLVASAMVCCLGTLPMFFQFELNPEAFPHYAALQCWGMVDTLMASIAALTAALMIASARTRSLSLASAGWLVGAFGMLIKPTGVLAIASAGLILVVEVVARAAETVRSDDPPPKRAHPSIVFGLSALVIGGVIFSAMLWICIRSPYLGADNQQLFSAAISVSRQLYSIAPIREFFEFVTCAVGWPITLLLFAGAIFRSVQLYLNPHQESRRALFIRLSGLLLLSAASLSWWWFMPGPIPRYYFPFITLLIIWIVSELFRWLMDSAATGITCMCLFIPPALLTALFFLPHPSVSAQRMLGVNLSVGLRSEELRAGRFLIRSAKKAQKSFKIYFLDGITTELPHHQDYIQWIHSKPRGMLLLPVRPNEWTGDPGLNLDRILECEYIVYEGTIQPTNPLPRRVVTDYGGEVHEFASFLSGLSKNQGVILRRFGQLTVVKLANPELFEKAYREWTSTIDWRTTFAGRNRVAK